MPTHRVPHCDEKTVMAGEVSNNLHFIIPQKRQRAPLIVPSLEAEATRTQSGLRCKGSHASALTHLVCLQVIITRSMPVRNAMVEEQYKAPLEKANTASVVCLRLGQWRGPICGHLYPCRLWQDAFRQGTYERQESQCE
jgi:hypothetical protein